MKLTINGITVSAKEGETILECALRHNILIPHLCTHPALPSFGACRLCVVEIEDMHGYPLRARHPQPKEWWCEPKQQHCKTCDGISSP